MKYKLLFLITGLSLLTLNACSDQSSSADNAATQKQPKPQQSTAKAETVERWYGFTEVSKGGKIFQENCASCHKKDASGTKNWKQTDAQGRYPPPPLNGDAHAWHHPMAVLVRSVKNGGVPLGGWMPAFKDKLTDEEIINTIAWIQSHWSNKTYSIWSKRNAQAGKPITALK